METIISFRPYFTRWYNINQNLDDTLKYAIDSGIIDISYVQEQIEMSKRKDLLSKHPYKITQGKDGKWRTYLPDKTKGRKLIKKSNLDAIEDAVVDFYKKIEEKPKTFDDVYHHWRKVQDTLIGDNSIAKYNTDYKRYFENKDFSKKYVEKITEEDIKVFIVQTVKSQRLCKKSCKTLFGYVRNTINSARINKIIFDNPMEFLEAKQFYKYCTDIQKSKEDKLISDSDMDKLYKRFQEDYISNPAYIPTYAVHFASLTGMRVGEISALTWDCITDTYILVDKSEKFNRITKEYFIDKTKNGKTRTFPLTEEIIELLNRIKKVELQNGFMSEYVFSNESGRIHAPMISSCSKNKCRQIGISEKGIHAYRRTLNSKMRCNGVSATVAASLLGHTEEVNEQYYTFDVSNIKEKAEIVSRATKKIG